MNSSKGNDSKSIDDELIQAYLDGETSAAQEEQVRRLLNEPWFCERLAHFAMDSACLHELGQQGVLEQSQPLRRQSRETSRLSAHESSDEGAGHFSRNRFVLVGTVMAVSLLLLILPFFRSRNADETPVAETPVLGHLGEVASAAIVRPGLGDEPATTDALLRSGDTLQTEGPEGFAAFLFADGTMLALVGDARVLLAEADGQKRVNVHYGDFDADVAPQPAGKPMLFVTPQAEARVMGTRLSISAGISDTTLNVTEGHVVMKRLSDGRSVSVRGGYQAVASPGSELKAQPAPSAPNIWSTGFEDGLPDNWRLGQWVTDDLPENSRGAVRSARWSIRSGLYYAVRSNRVTTGLFRVHADTYLNFTYKLDQPGWFNLFVVVHRNGADWPRTGNYAHNEAAWWRIPAGQWRTVSVPLTRFHKIIPGYSKNEPAIHPRDGDTVNSITFSTPKEDRGLTIDGMWVTRGEPANP